MELEYKDKLKKLRKEKGISQQKLADAIFVSRSAVAKWENGLGLPSKESQKALAIFFEVSDSYLSTVPVENVLIEKNKKIVALESIIAFIVLAALVSVAAMFIMGYSFSAESFIGKDYSKKYIFNVGEYTFSGVLWDVIESDDQMFDLFHAVKKRGFLYHEVTPSCSYLYTENGEYVAYLEKYDGKNSNYYFIKYVQTIGSAPMETDDEVSFKTTYSMLSEKIKVNGKEIKLELWSYFELDEPVETIEIEGQNLMISQDLL